MLESVRFRNEHLLLRRLSTGIAAISGTRDSSNNDKRITTFSPRPIPALSRFFTFKVRRGCRRFLPGAPGIEMSSEKTEILSRGLDPVSFSVVGVVF